jgi:hypothetical protein
MSSSIIVCPKCKAEIPVEEALSHAFREKIETEAKRNFGEEKRLLQEELDEKEKKLAEGRTIELQLRKQKLDLEEEKRNFELEKARQLDLERTKIREQTMNEATDSWRLKEKEFEKKLSDMKLALDDAQRKATQGSQQLQGEVAELDLENSLKAEFATDVIEPVGKGVKGADISQTVKTSMGNVCGTILFEIKRTKAWANDWPKKLKEDLRSAKANVGVIVSTVLPDEAKSGLGLVEGVWVVTPPLLISVVTLIRTKLIDVAREKYVSSNQASKSEKLYEFIASHEFSQQLEAIAEVYQEMNSEIARERAAMERIWKTREVQVRRLLTGTANIVGGIRGSGATMPSIKGIDLPELSDGE